MNSLKHLSILLGFLCFSTIDVLSAQAAQPLDEEAYASKSLWQQLEKDKVYPRMECLHLISETTGKEYFEFALREIHNTKCGGDPMLEPVVDRFRVSRKTKNIEWYDPLEDEFQSYADGLSNRRANDEGAE